MCAYGRAHTHELSFSFYLSLSLARSLARSLALHLSHALSLALSHTHTLSHSTPYPSNLAAARRDRGEGWSKEEGQEEGTRFA